MLTEAESALVVNNNAAAVLLVLIVLARNKEVVISRGELVQIGGGFRVPEIMQQSGVSLKEVGTTNQTYIKDYEAALSQNTALLLKVHQSNFVMKGFTHETSLSELKALAEKHNLPLVYDLGSGALLDSAEFGLGHEPTVQEALSGADIVCFSGDKLLGGPQAGVILGKKEYVDKLRQHPLMRVIRIDKLTATALAATARLYLKKEAVEKVPVWQMIAAPLTAIEARAKALAGKLAGASMVGGGSLPEETLPTKLLSIKPQCGVEEFARRLRLAEPPLLGRVEDGSFLVDIRTVLPALDGQMINTIETTLTER
jgi:L-seryl-tRNA(Ser) seleniumtransferase